MTNINEEGLKYDDGKLRTDLLFLSCNQTLMSLVSVLTFGAKKYKDENWRNVKNAKSRYVAAFFRHFYSWVIGDSFDKETKEHHLAHAICCLIFLLELDFEGKL